MPKPKLSFLYTLLCAFLISGFAVVQAQQESKKKTFQKKEIRKDKEPIVKELLDTVKKDNTKLVQREPVVDTLLIEKGDFKWYKDHAHVSYYADRFHGKRTASGKIFDMNKMTAAHKKLPFGTKVRVTNEANGKSVVVEVIDRGPFVKGREIDLSKKAFQAISSGRGGYVIAKIEVLKQ